MDSKFLLHHHKDQLTILLITLMLTLLISPIKISLSNVDTALMSNRQEGKKDANDSGKYTLAGN